MIVTMAIYMDGVAREVKLRIYGGRPKLTQNGRTWKVPMCLYSYDAVMFVETEEKVQRMVNELDRVCDRRKLKVNIGKNKVMGFETKEYEKIDFGKVYSVQRPNELSSWVELKEEASEFKYSIWE